MTVGEGEDGLGVVCNDNHLLSSRVFTVGGVYEALELDAKRAIDMGTSMAIKIHKRGGGIRLNRKARIRSKGWDGGVRNGIS